MTFSIKQLSLIASIITGGIYNNTYCAEQYNTLLDSTDSSSGNTSLEHGKKLSDDDIDTLHNKYKTIDNFTNTEDNSIHDFEYYKNEYQMLLSDNIKFKHNINLNYNNKYNNETRQKFFDVLHNIKDSLQKLVLSCSDITEQNKINTYINNNLKSIDIYLILT